MSRRHYDYIIAGAGLSGLSLAWRMHHTPSLADKKVLIIDENLNSKNDKTWSFWHNGAPPFEGFIKKSWKQVQVNFDGQSILQPLKTYTYHSIQSGDFRNRILTKLRMQNNVDLIEASIREMKGDKKEARLKTTEYSYSASYIFQSCFEPDVLKKDKPRFPLIQHFLGWEIETTKDVFDPSTITLMDFDPSFTDGIAFIYILPHTARKALLEYTIFSAQVQAEEFYEEKLAIYIHNRFNLKPLAYRPNRTEYGEIPMKDQPYAPWYGPRIVNMGAVGGLTKPSTGYTFSRIQNHVEATVSRLTEKGKPALPYRSPLRYRAYDLWLLQILHDHPRQAVEIFRQLFSQNTLDEVFRFLGEESSILQDLKTMSRFSYLPFFRAMWKTKKRLLKL